MLRTITREESELLDILEERGRLHPDFYGFDEEIEVEYKRQTGDFTVATVVDVDGKVFVGASHKSKLDKDTPELGELLAFRRAVMDAPVTA